MEILKIKINILNGLKDGTFNGNFFVAECLNNEIWEVVGCVGYHKSGTKETEEFNETKVNSFPLPRPFIYCGSLSVTKSSRGKGIARSLMEQINQEALRLKSSIYLITSGLYTYSNGYHLEYLFRGTDIKTFIQKIKLRNGKLPLGRRNTIWRRNCK